MPIICACIYLFKVEIAYKMHKVEYEYMLLNLQQNANHTKHLETIACKQHNKNHFQIQLQYNYIQNVRITCQGTCTSSRLLNKSFVSQNINFKVYNPKMTLITTLYTSFVPIVLKFYIFCTSYKLPYVTILSIYL